jgi:serine-type D-Ala-D-Ala carboxypeptidase/endopeptidase
MMIPAVVCSAGLVFGSLICSGPASAQVPNPAALSSDLAIEKLLTARVDAERRSVGIVVGIVTPAGRRIVSYGHASLEEPRAVDGDTVFEIGSVTKVFTAVLLADMVRRGEVKLTDSVFSYLPPHTSRARESRTITLADLATHTSGLPFWPNGIPATADGVRAMGRYTDVQLLEYLSTFAVPPDVGQKWTYSNIDAGVLGRALGARANMTYDAVLQARVTGPLQMANTAVGVSDRMRRRLAVGYDANRHVAPAWNVPALAGAGSLHSSANDLLTFLDALGRDDGPLAGLLPIMLATRRPGPGIPQALGWMVIETSAQEGAILSHDGGTLGFSSAVSYDPKARTGVVVLSNAAGGVGDLARHVLRPSIPLTPPASTAPTRTEIHLDPLALDRLVGRYEPSPGVGFEVSREGDWLSIQLPGIPKLRLRAETPRSFYAAENTRVTITFDVDADGRATALTLSAPTGTTGAKRVVGK